MPKVVSSAVEAVGYDEARREPIVTYTGGARYAYAGVEPGTYAELLAAESIGAFVNRVIKPDHAAERLTSPRERAR